MIVVDASAALSALISGGPARSALETERLHAPHLIDAEVANGLRRRLLGGAVTGDQALSMLRVWRAIGISRHPGAGTLERVWELRENLSAYDASYVALAEALCCSLLTADRRLSRAPGIRCAITLVP